MRSLKGCGVNTVLLATHDDRQRSKSNPAIKQLGAEIIRVEGEEAPDIGTPYANTRCAHRQGLIDRGLQAVEAKTRRWVPAPDDRRARRRAGPAGTGKPRQRFAGIRSRRRHATVIIPCVAIVKSGTCQAIG